MRNRLFMGMTSRARLFIFLTACLLLLTYAVNASSLYPYDTKTEQSVNMRRSPHATSVILERIDKGETISVLGETGDYYHIKYKGRDGYAMKQYILAITPAATPLPNMTATGYPYVTTTSSVVNMRKSASTSSDLVKRLNAGTVITVEGVSGVFLKITCDGAQGYVMAEFVNVKLFSNASSGYAHLTNGDSGDGVYALQLALKELGFLNGQADGKYGQATQNAVRAFQEKNKYPQTGSADQNLQALIYEGTPLNKNGAKQKVNALSPLPGATIRLNNVGKAVTQAAQRLRELGYYNGTVGEVYTASMSASVKSFQKKNGLEADGVIGSKTKETLFSSNALYQSSSATPVPTAAPTVWTLPTGTVQNGSKGANAMLVQQRLKELGYLTGTVDGQFGAKSVSALKAFQSAHRITPDGICGKSTAAVLFSASAVPANPAATPSPVPIATLPVITKTNCVTVYAGVTGEAVLNLQKRLTALGYYTARHDGRCLSDDTAAITAFQTSNRLKADGIAGYETQSLLYSDKALGPTGFNTTFTTLKRGDSGQLVTRLQERLTELLFLGKGSTDGKYGEKTAQAVSDFQRASGLVRDGIAGSKTQTLLYAQNAVRNVPQPTPTAAVKTGTVRMGDVNEAVKSLQQRLITLGFLSGKADGVFGAKTLAALMAFQAKNGLSSDGIAGPNTWTTLNSSSAKKASDPDRIDAPAGAPRASSVLYQNWYTSVRSVAKAYPYATVYDFSTGLSWQVHIFSIGAHGDAEPLTAADTANMVKAFGGKHTWNPKAVWVIFGNGAVYMASTHDYPHEVQHRLNNNFNGHMCIHFPRTQAQVESIGPYAVSHQAEIDKGWAATQRMK